MKSKTSAWTIGMTLCAALTMPVWLAAQPGMVSKPEKISNWLNSVIRHGQDGPRCTWQSTSRGTIQLPLGLKPARTTLPMELNRLLLKHGADPNAVSHKGQTPMALVRRYLLTQAMDL
jgi:hypothetical protein